MHGHGASSTFMASTGLWVGIGLLLIAIAVPLMLRKIKRNGLYGFRSARTLADDRVWYEVNAVVGRDLAIVGAALVVTALATRVAGVDDRHLLVTLHTAVLLVGVGASTVHGWLVMRRM